MVRGGGTAQRPQTGLAGRAREGRVYRTPLSVLLPCGHGGCFLGPTDLRLPSPISPPPPALAAAAGFGAALISILLVWEVGQRGAGKISTAKLHGEEGGGPDAGARGGHWEQVPNPIKK